MQGWDAMCKNNVCNDKLLNLSLHTLFLDTCAHSVQGAEDAGDKLSTMDVFTKAQTLKVDPDKPLQQLRIRTLEVRYIIDAYYH